MINVEGKKWIPSEGYKYITNGDVFTDSIVLGTGDNITNWHDTNDEPVEPEPDPDPEEALAILLGEEEA